MEHNDPRRRHSSQDFSHRERSRFGHERDDRASRERYAESGGFSPDWSRDNAEPLYSDDPYYARNRDRSSHRADDPQRGIGPGGWQGDENRRSTEEQRMRGMGSRESYERGGERAGGYGLGERDDFGRNYPYGGPSEGRDTEQWSRGREDDEGSHYRGYYRRSSAPFRYPGGSGAVYSESWTLVGPFTGRGPKGYRRSDQQLVDDASQRLERDGHIDASEIEVTAQDGVITLRGTVPDRATKRRAEDCVESVYGARDVMNELRVESQGASESEGSQASQSSQGSQKGQRSRSQAQSSTAGRPGSTASGQDAEEQKH